MGKTINFNSKEIKTFLDWLSVVLSFAMFLLLYAMIVWSTFNDGKLLIHTNDYNEMTLEVVLFGVFLAIAVWRAPSICKKIKRDVRETYSPIVYEEEEIELPVQQEEPIFSFLN